MVLIKTFLRKKRMKCHSFPGEVTIKWHWKMRISRNPWFCIFVSTFSHGSILRINIFTRSIRCHPVCSEAVCRLLTPAHGSLRRPFTHGGDEALADFPWQIVCLSTSCLSTRAAPAGCISAPVNRPLAPIAHRGVSEYAPEECGAPESMLRRSLVRRRVFPSINFQRRRCFCGGWGFWYCDENCYKWSAGGTNSKTSVERSRSFRWLNSYWWTRKSWGSARSSISFSVLKVTEAKRSLAQSKAKENTNHRWVSFFHLSWSSQFRRYCVPRRLISLWYLLFAIFACSRDRWCLVQF